MRAPTSVRRNLGRKTERIVRGRIASAVAGDFPMNRDIGKDEGSSETKALGNRIVEAFVPAELNQRRCSAIELA
jgi:hypothetical protein